MHADEHEHAERLRARSEAHRANAAVLEQMLRDAASSMVWDLWTKQAAALEAGALALRAQADAADAAARACAQIAQRSIRFTRTGRPQA